ncbi:hypothetical protein [Longimicrobium sp.]|uniref:hypothetical protein n=1 Tax=Longimicrobium sp. TaxID=2029185 RepID=UPI002D806737|nr:hypothetical protein [Longimicrobium sp.]
MGDTYNVILFLRELYPDQKQLHSAVYDETVHLTDEGRTFVWENSGKHWLAERTLDFGVDSDNPDKNVLVMGVGELTREVEQLERSIDDLRLPEGMGEFDLAAFTDRHSGLKGGMRLKIRACHTILERVRTRCLYYALRIEGQLNSQQKTSDLVSSIQQEVHNFYATRCEPAYQRMRKAAELLPSSDPEDHALLLTSIRRAVNAVADYHYPPSGEPVVCLDGKSRQLGEEQYLNRLEEFCRTRFGADTSSRLLRAELDLLSVLIRRINEVASKGVHTDVTHAEARQGLLGLYIFLSNLIIKLEHAT